jgi:hypothetical protein
MSDEKPFDGDRSVVPDVLFDPRNQKRVSNQIPPNSVFAIDTKPADISSPTSNFKVGIVYSPTGEQKPTSESWTQDYTEKRNDMETQADGVSDTTKDRSTFRPQKNRNLDEIIGELDDYKAAHIPDKETRKDLSSDSHQESHGDSYLDSQNCFQEDSHNDSNKDLHDAGDIPESMRQSWEKFRSSMPDLRGIMKQASASRDDPRRQLFLPNPEQYYFEGFNAYDAGLDLLPNRGKMAPNWTIKTESSTDRFGASEAQFSLLREAIDIERRRRQDLESRIFEIDARTKFDYNAAKKNYNHEALYRAMKTSVVPPQLMAGSSGTERAPSVTGMTDSELARAKNLLLDLERTLREEKSASDSLRSYVDTLRKDVRVRLDGCQKCGSVKSSCCCCSDYCNCTRINCTDWERRLIHKQKILWGQKVRHDRQKETEELATYLNRVSMSRDLADLNKHVREMRANLLNAEGAIQRSQAVDHWLTVFPGPVKNVSSEDIHENTRIVGVPGPCWSDPGGSSPPLDPVARDAEWGRKLRIVQNGQWESYSKLRSSG